MGRDTLRKGKAGTKSKLGNISRARRGPAHSWRPSKTTVAIVREQYAKTRKQKRENADARNKYIKASVDSVKRLMKVKRIPSGRFQRSMFNTLSRHRCKPANINGVRKYASVYLGPHIKNEDKPAIRACIDYPLHIIEGIDNVPIMLDMGYLFVIGTTKESNNESDAQIYFQPVLSSLELGSQHAILVMRTGIVHVYAAGEMRKEGKHVDYNMLSGTFMVGFKYETNAIDMTDTLFGSLRDHDMTVKHNKSGRPLIDRDVLKGELLHANRCGYSVELFNDEKRCTLDQRYEDAKKKGQGKAFLETRRNVMRNISADNVERALANTSKRLYEPNETY